MALVLAGAAPVMSAPAQQGSPDACQDKTACTTNRTRGVELRLNFEGGRKRAGDVVRRTRNTGSARLSAVVVRAHGGEARRAKGRYSRWSLRLPRFDATSAPRATVAVTSRRRDPLSPLGRDFAIGIDFWLNRTSAGNADDGDNLLQRGAFRSRSQYKLQVDDRLPLCRVKGDGGAVMVTADEVAPGRWYRILCERAGSRIRLRVWRLDGDSPVLVSEVTERGRIGRIDDEQRVPLSVGGRLRDDSSIPARAGDQFNGMVDRVIYDRR